MTTEEVIEKWNRRGERYAMRRSLSPAELSSVMDYRRKEIGLAPAIDRHELETELASWYRKLRGETR